MISACLIAKNEEKWLGERLEHLKPLVSEIILVDTGSTDRTVEIAREKGARVSQIKWENDFAKAPNVSLEKATQRWILIIDPDERICPRDMEAFKKLTETKDVMAYSFNTRNYSTNTMSSGYKPCKGEYPEELSYPGFFESRKVRLFQNIPSTRFVGSVHELVESTIKGKVVESDLPIHHYGSTPEVEAEKGKKQFYQEQGKKKIRENPNDWKAHFELGVEYLTAGEFVKAAQQLEKARNIRPRDPLILSNLGYAHMESGRYDQAAAALDDCLKIEANYHDAMLNLGVIRMRKGQWQEAVQLFQGLVEKHKFSFLAYRNMGLCFAHTKNYQAAASCFEKALKIFPQFTEARIDLGVICFAAGRPDLAKPILEEAIRLDPRSLRARATLDEVNTHLSRPNTKR